MVVREAFAFGTPAAVSDLGPLPSIVRHGESGLVFEAGNPAALLQEVRLLGQRLASWRRSAMGHAPPLRRITPKNPTTRR
jgi:glycosyltransferase involved in cell wall biosynthesis